MIFSAPPIHYRTPGTLKAHPDRYDHIAIIAATDADLTEAPFGDSLNRRVRAQKHTKTSADILVTDAPNNTGTTLALGFIEPTIEPFALLELARKLTTFKPGVKKVAFATYGLKGIAQQAAIDALVTCLYARAPLPHFQSKPEPHAYPAADVFGPGQNARRLLAQGRGNHLARSLSVLPGNHLTPALYVKRVKTLAREHGWRYRFLDEKKLKSLGAGAFLAVTQTAAVGSGIVHLRYTPAKPSRRSVALVGKGICFDTGGVDVKPARHMYGMHEDMEGSAVALGTLLALTDLKVPFAVDCYLAIAENAIGPRAYRPNDVVRAMNGTTIEIVHTDAEGRMVLADTLSLASRSKPHVVIDYATLTGACVYALGSRMTGVFTNRPALLSTLIEAGRASGERVWPFPLPNDYASALKSDIADTKQCTLDGEADHILAALFLQRFLYHDPTWVHLDLSAGQHKGGLGAIPSNTTGFGVHFSVSLLLDHSVI